MRTKKPKADEPVAIESNPLASQNYASGRGLGQDQTVGPARPCRDTESARCLYSGAVLSQPGRLLLKLAGCKRCRNSRNGPRILRTARLPWLRKTSVRAFRRRASVIWGEPSIVSTPSEEAASRRVKAVRCAAPSHAKLLLIELLMPNEPGPSFTKTLDILMLSVFGGRQRTNVEYRTLLSESNFQLDRIVEMRAGFSILEASTA